MRWEIISLETLQSLPRDWYLPGQKTALHAIAVESDTLHMMALPSSSTDPGDEDRTESIAVAIYSPAELNTNQAWAEIFMSLGQVHAVDLACFQKAHPEIDPARLLEALGKRSDYRALADWQELGALDTASQELARSYGFPINTLRLWNRLESNDQAAWLQIWQNRNVKKNLIREIIHDFYDLSPENRGQALQAAVDLDAGWGQGVFPSEKLRGIVRDLRYPQFEKMRQKVYSLKRAMQLPRQMELLVPEDLEASQLELKLKFGSLSELDQLTTGLQDERLRDNLRQLLGLL